MKLRNKKTGEIAEDTEILVIFASKENVIPTYHSLTELNEEWEDYEPIDVEDINVTNIPLIKNVKMCKAVKAWAEVNEIETAEYDDYWVSFRSDDKVISFKDEDTCIGLYNLEDNKTYTIAELCGEDE